MNILVVGSGAREHALCKKIVQSPLVQKLYCIPGNVGIAQVAECVLINEENVEAIAQFSLDNAIHLVVVGPEQPLALGLADILERRGGGAVFGPSSHAAEIESSKSFAKYFMDRHKIPTAPWILATRRGTVRRASRALGGGVVLKSDGLKRGKGVHVVRNPAEMNAALNTLFPERGDAQTVLIENYVEGTEVSATCLSDGNNIVMLPDAMDYKQAYEGDTGPNTGGMGAHSPSFVLNDAQREFIRVHIMQKTIDGLAGEGRKFIGALTVNLKINPEGAMIVLEFNARFGDPECQVQLARIDEDIVPLLYGAATKSLAQREIRMNSAVAAAVVLTSTPYPDTPRVGDVIGGLDTVSCAGAQVYFAGAQRNTKGDIIAQGGRVLNVCATGRHLRSALRKAYATAGRITWHNKRVRKDIGWRVLDKYGS